MQNLPIVEEMRPDKEQKPHLNLFQGSSINYVVQPRLYLHKHAINRTAMVVNSNDWHYQLTKFKSILHL